MLDVERQLSDEKLLDMVEFIKDNVEYLESIDSNEFSSYDDATRIKLTFTFLKKVVPK